MNTVDRMSLKVLSEIRPGKVYEPYSADEAIYYTREFFNRLDELSDSQLSEQGWSDKDRSEIPVDIIADKERFDELKSVMKAGEALDQDIGIYRYDGKIFVSMRDQHVG